MDFFNRQDDVLYAEQCSVKDLAAKYQTPLYVYSRATIERHWHAFDQAAAATEHLICYAVKASSNIAILNVLARLGSGFDIVSKGELARVIQAGGDPAKVVFSGVGKKADEIAYALEKGIHCFNVESEAELSRINDVAGKMGLKAPISLRVNPDVDAGTHPYISTGLKDNKFGIAIDSAIEVYQKAAAMPHLVIKGVDCHIGSQLTEVQPFLDALDRVLLLVDSLAQHGIKLSHLDVGGGLGVPYQGETPPHPSEYAKAIADKMQGYDLQLIYEPGRAIMANAGILVTEVEFLKTNEDKHFAIVDGAMNDLIRPSLYQAWQEIVPVQYNHSVEEKLYDVVGPVCETGDFLGKERSLAISAGDLLAVRSAGAYGFTMSSNYNSRPRVAEVMVDGDQHHLIRQRESIESLWMGEQVLP
ncbi:diaminopimelate decarboxylase [Thalassotalea sp. HSM 43]|uniref:diaminopimelate decarboxylase n=1 Tax=Thalassotalea sp. HSM 43 TaxID=2552945 RepID=UPI0010818178|nr:diaminopimelate decarboxylase [Thalassotalea sp. HSM 43]QBY04061.1 diaminopimelate decarboxylase [Thalassotalea sp. HSM 43]